MVVAKKYLRPLIAAPEGPIPIQNFEERNLLCWNLDTVARLRIASDAGLALPGAETAEAADFDLVSGAQRPDDAVENSLDDHFAVFAGHFRQPRDFIDQVRFCHSLFPLPCMLNLSGRASSSSPILRCLTFSNIRTYCKAASTRSAYFHK